MGFFPTSPNDGDEIGPNTNGSYFKYVAADDKWILIPNADVYTEAEVDAFKLNKWNTPDGNIAMGTYKITGVGDPDDNQDAATKKYVDDNAGDTKEEAHDYVEETALTLENDLNMGTHNITNVGNVDGKDVSSLCTEAEAHAYVESHALTLTENIITEDILPAENYGLIVDGTLSADGKYSGTIITLTNTQTYGKAVYISANNTVAACDKDSINLAIGVSVGTGRVLILGTVREDDWDWSAGDPIYVGDNGALTDDISAYATGDLVQCVGVAVDANTVLVKDICWVEVA